MPYPKSYHAAINHLIVFGAYDGNRVAGRKLIATALRTLRFQYGRERAARERRHMLFISGQFPVKECVPEIARPNRWVNVETLEG